MVDFLIDFIPRLLLWIAVGLIVYLINIIREQRHSPRRYSRQKSEKAAAKTTASATVKPQINPHLQRTLLGMVGGDKALAQRLVSSARAGRPGQSENWYWEKVIHDLEHDRR